jgi:thiamine kinase-like enzyme
MGQRVTGEAETRLRGALAACGRAPAGRLAWRLLSGSSSSSSYRVDTGTEILVVRLNAPRRDPVLALGREHDLLVAVAAAGIGPEVIGIDPARAALVLRCVESRTWTPEDARGPVNVERAAQLLHVLHRVDAACRVFEPQHDASWYCERARRHGRLAARDLPLARELESLAEEHMESTEPRVLCHNDLVAANVLDDGTLLLVDFEYAVRAPAIVDLASLAAMNDFGRTERVMLLTAYYGSEAAAPSIEALDDVIRLQGLLAYFWALSADSEAILARRATFADRTKLKGERDDQWRRK